MAEVRTLRAAVPGRNVAYGDRPVQRLDVYRPSSAAASRGSGDAPAVIAIHGGGWRKGSRSEFGPVAASLTKAGFVVISISYTLSKPGQPSWPVVMDDIQTAVRWVRSNAASLGIDPVRIAAIGESSSGHLAELLGTYPDRVVDGVSSRVNAVVSFGGPSDLIRCAIESRQGAVGAIGQMLGAWPSVRPDLAADASPLTHVDTTSAPMLLIHGTADRLIPPSQSTSLASALAAHGVRSQVIAVPGSAHVHVGPGLSYNGMPLYGRIVAFLRETLDGS
jgi:acetyl esterase/lipase